MSNELTPNEPDAGAPDAVAPDAVAPDAVAPDAVAPDAVAPDTVEIPSDAEQPVSDTETDAVTAADETIVMDSDPSASATAAADPGDGSSQYVPPHPPPPAAVPAVRRLVRDPYSRLGGVASGIGHHYGIDVSLVRLAFILATLFSGIGLILYFLAWLIIPRADYWPPVPAGASGGQRSSIEGREMALGLLGLGVLLAVFAGGGGATRMLVSVGLVGAGIWMLTQPSRSDGNGASVQPSPVGPPANPVAPHVPSSWEPASADAANVVAGPDDEFTSGFPGTMTPQTGVAAGTAAATATYPASQTVYVPAPVPPRRRRIWPFFLIASIFLIPLLIAIAVFGALFGLAGGEFNGDFEARTMTIRPAEVVDIPATITLGAGEIVVDLTDLDAADFADLEMPHELEIDLNAGEVVVELPEDIAVSVEANAGAGDVRVFDSYRDGIRPGIDISEDEAVLDLDIRVGVGEIRVRR